MISAFLLDNNKKVLVFIIFFVERTYFLRKHNNRKGGTKKINYWNAFRQTNTLLSMILIEKSLFIHYNAINILLKQILITSIVRIDETMLNSTK